MLPLNPSYYQQPLMTPSSPAHHSHPYIYHKPSSLATRTLVTGQKPVHEKPVNHYEHAVQAAGQSQPKNETTGATPTGNADSPGLGRQQSWNMQDRKRDHHTSMLADKPNEHGYSSTSK
ncbi:hypothetical protein CLAFUW4_03593 [Fulvia fulva]|uniref:Uncharacterized protein n=1 Tax=Passalora fulva TaxID=5499 RepID=A0A9Q8LB29_PASFU|nr:uncharacterized protein CLAFUR5_03573 [Fulvia fulva]KAK4631263.1 hypothetical protein CLAFUR4_03581 [Fulvia fulva]KAK4633498.1 hypothetical protein CLAFUR0_03584 [Fulvia fulva]UJO14152.1 hypothetical protein CLAFUR5_03573 [Fulvia fulva]WPV11417.1 hypothetical protein CLAFUW4_03593 [Fulvia fulva]WPV26416.1 hypothetical protein CLAFUW7_03585 [Fulvia fulva]